MQRCSTVAERALSPPFGKVSVRCRRSLTQAHVGKCVERDTNAFAIGHVSTLARAIHYRLHAYTCKRPLTHLNAYIWMHACEHAFIDAIAVAMMRTSNHIYRWMMACNRVRSPYVI